MMCFVGLDQGVHLTPGYGYPTGTSLTNSRRAPGILISPSNTNCCGDCGSVFLAANLALAGFPLTNALGESMPSRY